MPIDTGIPAAQYLRMSTDQQQYSLDNQADAIARYAAHHGFQIVKTYSDAAKSGLRLKNRAGLKQLLADVMEGQLVYRAVLVYDVSRWGRFQDLDEAAHYEYLCKSSGVPVHYCAEMFSNDNSMLNLIYKALKRGMAAEYSRELSVKVKAGLVHLARLGYKLGGSAPFGLRRQLLDAQGSPKQVLEYGERKSLANEHVIFIPGPPEEVDIVRRIFREFADEHRSPNSIAARLNREGIPYLRGATWKGNTLRVLLQDTHYIGMQVWGRTTGFLSGHLTRLSLGNWEIHPDAFQPIISKDDFLRAQQVFANYACRLTDEQFLERARQTLKAHGRVSARLIDRSRLCPGASAYRRRFKGLMNLYARLGYETPEIASQINRRQRSLLLRHSLIQSMVETFPGEIQEVRRNGRLRSLLRYRRTGLLISVVVARYGSTRKGESRWFIESAPRDERKRVTILALLDNELTRIQSMRVFPRLECKFTKFRVASEGDWLRSGQVLEKVADFIRVLQEVRGSR